MKKQLIALLFFLTFSARAMEVINENMTSALRSSREECVTTQMLPHAANPELLDVDIFTRASREFLTRQMLAYEAYPELFNVDMLTRMSRAVRVTREMLPHGANPEFIDEHVFTMPYRRALFPPDTHPSQIFIGLQAREASEKLLIGLESSDTNSHAIASYIAQVKKFLEEEDDFQKLLEKAKHHIGFSESEIWPKIIIEAIYEIYKDSKDLTKLIIACELSGVHRMDKWIEHYISTEDGIDELNLGADNRTPLISAIARGSTSVVRMLLKGGAFVDLKNDVGDTPLMLTLNKNCCNSAEIAQILLDNGVSIDEQNENGYTLFHLAILTNNREMAQFSRDRKADISLPSKQGLTPFGTAVEYDLADMVKLLLELGVDPNSTIEKKPVLVIAAENYIRMLEWKVREPMREARCLEICKMLQAHPKLVPDDTIRELLNSLKALTNSVE